MRILIVDDDSVTRKLLTSILNEYGNCQVAVDGEEALKAFSEAFDTEHRYDCMCLDIMMPHIDGLQVLKRVRELEEASGVGGLDGIKIIMTSALSDPKSILGAFRSGCEAYVTKPFNKDKLLRSLRQLNLLPQTLP